MLPSYLAELLNIDLIAKLIFIMGYLPLLYPLIKYSLLANFLFERDDICKPRHMKCFQTIFSNSYLLTDLATFSMLSSYCWVRFDIYMQKKHTILCWIFDPTFQFLSYYKLLHTQLHALVFADSSYGSTSAVLGTRLLILWCPRQSK